MFKNKKDILILCSRLDLPGGKERAITNIANLFVLMDHKVTIAVLDENSNSYYHLNDQIQIFSKPLHFGITSAGNTLTRKYAFAKHIFQLRKVVKQMKPDAVISTDYPYSIALVLGKIQTYAKIISWEHHHFYHLKKNWFWQLLCKRFYPRLDMIICLNQEEAKLFEQIGCRTCVIPNFRSFAPAEKTRLDKTQILTVGWLTPTKGADLIPEIAERVFEKQPNWTWKIIGDGEEKNLLQHALSSLVISDPVLNIEAEYKNSSIYVLPSRFECFPMVLLEAMSAGVPCIAFDCPTGPKHIIRSEEDGILIEKENTTAMASAIIELIEDDEKRKRLGANAFENVKRFSPEHIYQQWEDLFNGS